MKVLKITYPTALSKISEFDNDNIDIFVELEDGNTYTLVISTPKNIMSLIEKSNGYFLEVGSPLIIVKELSEECIYKAIVSFSEGEAYWVKEYHLSGSFNVEMFNKMIDDEKS